MSTDSVKNRKSFDLSENNDLDINALDINALDINEDVVSSVLAALFYLPRERFLLNTPALPIRLHDTSGESKKGEINITVHAKQAIKISQVLSQLNPREQTLFVDTLASIKQALQHS